MRDLAQLLTALAEFLPPTAGDATAGAQLIMTDLCITLPLEARLRSGGAIVATLPRGRMATGFDLPHAHMTARFETQDA